MNEMQIELRHEIAGLRSQVDEVRTTQSEIRQSEIQPNISPQVLGRDPTHDITSEVRNPLPNNNFSPPKVDFFKIETLMLRTQCDPNHVLTNF